MAQSDRFRAHMASVCAADPSAEVLVNEACRIIDRLGEIDDIVTGKTEWISLMHFRVKNDDQQTVTVTLDGVLAEARQQSGALKSLMAQLGIGRADMSGKKESKGDPVDEIAARRTARGGSTARVGRAKRGAS